MDKVFLRPAHPQDARPAARLIYSTGPASFNLAFGSHDRAISLLERLFAKPGTISSYRYATVATLNSRVVGILVLTDTDAAHQTQALTGLELLRLVGPLFILFRLPVYLRQSGSSQRPKPGELFISDVAVAPEFHGKGIGRLLMREAERIAREKSYKKLALEVSESNLQAISLYTSLGYTVTSEFADPWLKWRFGLSGVYRMSKTLHA